MGKKVIALVDDHPSLQDWVKHFEDQSERHKQEGKEIWNALEFELNQIGKLPKDYDPEETGITYNKELNCITIGKSEHPIGELLAKALFS